MASMVSILLALLVTFNAIGPVTPGNLGKSTGSLSTPEKSRPGDFQKILPAEPELASEGWCFVVAVPGQNGCPYMAVTRLFRISRLPPEAKPAVSETAKS